MEGEGEAAEAPPDGVSLRLCVLPLRGVGLKRYGVDGDLLPNKAMAALNELLLDAAPVAPVEEDAVRPPRPNPSGLRAYSARPCPVPLCLPTLASTLTASTLMVL